MNKTLKVIKPYGWMEYGEVFELSNDGKSYVNSRTNEYTTTYKDSDFSSKLESSFSISTDYAKALVDEGVLSEDVENPSEYKNVFNAMDDMIDTYQEDLNNIETDMKDSPQCLKVEKETVLRNLIKAVSYLRSLKK